MNENTDRATFIGLVLAVAMLAGCLQGGGDPGLQSRTLEGPPETVAPAKQEPATFNLTTGGVQGTVIDDELRPLSNATVRLSNDVTNIVTRTTVDGRFALDDVAPGLYNITATAVGHLTTFLLLDVVAGKVVEADLLLPVLAVQEPYTESRPHSGYIEVGAAAIRRTTTSNFGANRFQLDGFPDTYEGLVVEAQWNGGHGLEFLLTSRTQAGADNVYYGARGESGIRFFAARCGFYADEGFANRPLPCSLAEIREVQRGPSDPANASRYANLQTNYLGLLEPQMHVLDPVCTSPTGTFPASEMGCYGVGAMPEIRWETWVSFFHRQLPPDASQFSVFVG